MVEALVHITTTVISGCIVALFTHWLRTRNNKKKIGDISQRLKIPSLLRVVRGLVHIIHEALVN